MKKSPAFPVYTKDWDTDERVLLMDEAEEGTFFRLLRHQWREGSVPADLATLARIVRVGLPRMQRLWKAVGPCFEPHPTLAGRLVNSKTERVREQQKAYLNRRSSAGKRGAESRWQSHPIANATAMAPLAIAPLSPAVAVAVAVPRTDERKTAGDHVERPNPLVTGRRVDLEREALQLCSEVARLQDKDPAEVMQTAAHYQGARTSKINPANMSDDRLLNTVLDLRATLAAEKAKPRAVPRQA